MQRASWRSLRHIFNKKALAIARAFLIYNLLLQPGVIDCWAIRIRVERVVVYYHGPFEIKFTEMSCLLSNEALRQTAGYISTNRIKQVNVLTVFY